MKTPQTASLQDLIEPVIANDICVGCGACAVLGNGQISMRRTTDGACVAEVNPDGDPILDSTSICPFSDTAPDEDAHGARLFADAPQHNGALGRFRATFAGFSRQNNFRANGSSGGLTSWILAEAMAEGLIDAVVHVHPNSDSGELFTYRVSRSIQQIEAGAKTRYYSIHFADAIAEVRQSGERFAVVGVPCFIKAARNLAMADTRLDEQMVLAVSIVCGHMKSAGFAQSLAWQAGVPPDQLVAADFRVKFEKKAASQYGFGARAQGSDNMVVVPMAKLAGRRWDGGYHRLKACDYCDDVFGETADVSFGDAWLPEFSKDPLGTNVLVARSETALKLIERGRQRGVLSLFELAPERAVASQAGGLRDRREGLSYRLYLDDRANRWRPRKRVEATSEDIRFLRKLNYRLRRIVRSRSKKSLRLSKKLKTVLPYRLEMTFWHACFRLLEIIGSRFSGTQASKSSTEF